jgi:hypothetical protein
VDVRLVILNNNLYIILIDKDMKPLNLDNRPCSPTSSNCVIWSGRNIPCINLCTGDTVTDVIEKLATELCTIIDQLNISNYDLRCFNITACPPSSFAELIQFLIEQICASQGISTTGKELSSGCPDCVVTMAPCFITGTQTTMQLVDYVNLIANRVCSIGETIIAMQTQITDLDIRVTILENEPDPVFTLPTITVDCTLQASPFIGNGGPATSIDLVLDALINDDTYGYCALKFRTGDPATIYTAITTQCIQDGDFTLSNPLLTYGGAYLGSWVNTADIENLADSITDIWIVLCDIYTAFNNITINVADTTTIDLTYTGGILTADVVDTGWHDLLGFDYYTATMATQKPQARRIGKVIHFRGNVFVPLDDPARPPGTVVPLSTPSSYYNVLGCDPYTGSGGVFIDSGDQSIFFNNSGSVIPTSVLASGPTDGVYTMGYIIAVRPIELTLSTGTSLTASMVVGITSTKQLYISALKDLENISTRTPDNVTGGAPLRYITSNVKTGDYVPNFINAASYINSANNTGVNNIVTETEFPGPVDLQWTFDCDAGTPSNLGGFSFRIDGLMSYIS